MSYGKANIDFYFLLLEHSTNYSIDQLIPANLVLHIMLAEDF